jgi:hypothetical protein
MHVFLTSRFVFRTSFGVDGARRGLETLTPLTYANTKTRRIYVSFKETSKRVTVVATG